MLRFTSHRHFLVKARTRKVCNHSLSLATDRMPKVFFFPLIIIDYTEVSYEHMYICGLIPDQDTLGSTTLLEYHEFFYQDTLRKDKSLLLDSSMAKSNVEFIQSL
jgi:hypothetical protein